MIITDIKIIVPFPDGVCYQHCHINIDKASWLNIKVVVLPTYNVLTKRLFLSVLSVKMPMQYIYAFSSQISEICGILSLQMVLWRVINCKLCNGLPTCLCKPVYIETKLQSLDEVNKNVKSKFQIPKETSQVNNSLIPRISVLQQNLSRKTIKENVEIKD